MITGNKVSQDIVHIDLYLNLPIPDFPSLMNWEGQMLPFLFYEWWHLERLRAVLFVIQQITESLEIKT